MLQVLRKDYDIKESLLMPISISALRVSPGSRGRDQFTPFMSSVAGPCHQLEERNDIKEGRENDPTMLMKCCLWS